MNCRNFDEIMEHFPGKRALFNYAEAKLPAEIINSMQHLAGNDLSCDCRFENDDGGYLYSQREDADQFVLVATSGQGDEWLLKLSDGEIYFLDHDNWEEEGAITSMKISFQQFVSMADLLGQFENLEPTEHNIKILKKQFCLIHHMLLDRYPFELI